MRRGEFGRCRNRLTLSDLSGRCGVAVDSHCFPLARVIGHGCRGSIAGDGSVRAPVADNHREAFSVHHQRPLPLGDPKPARGTINTSGRGGPYLDENCVLVVTERTQDFYRGERQIPIFSDPTGLWPVSGSRCKLMNQIIKGRKRLPTGARHDSSMG